MISEYLVLHEDSLEEWHDDPESYVQIEETDHWEYDLKGCAEKLLMVLVSRNRALLCPFLIETMSNLPNGTLKP